VAEEVEKVDPDLVARDEQGRLYTVRYEAVNAMLLNEFLKEHRRVEEQQSKIAEQEAIITKLKCSAAKQEAAINELKGGMATVISRLKEHESELQRVRNQGRSTESAVRLVASDP
jgi:uncharacterized coiled-coil protein SlyX